MYKNFRKYKQNCGIMLHVLAKKRQFAIKSMIILVYIKDFINFVMFFREYKLIT